jgi:hypothetical protein
MKIKSNKYIVYPLILVGLICSYFFINYIFDRKSINTFGFKDLFSVEQKAFVRRYFFPFRLIKIQEDKLSILEDLMPQMSELELLYQRSLKDIEIKYIGDTKLSNNMILKKYNLVTGFYSGIWQEYPGSGYLDFNEENFFLLSSRGVLSFENKTKIDNYDINRLMQINHNIENFINIKQYQKTHTSSLKGLFIDNNKIYISYTAEIKNDCWNTSVIYGDIDYKYINFKKLFEGKKCIEFDSVPAFEFHQSGGRIVKFDDNHILLTVGDYRDRTLAQKKDSINGKTLKININNGDFEFISMGHRNQQGMYFDSDNGLILQTEHGPKGGDEINIIEVDKIKNKKYLNYGWPISSYGEHYRGKKGDEIYKKFPLHKSHSKFGFIEPLKYFDPSIGISEIVKLKGNKYVIGSMRDKSLYFFELKDKKVINIKRVSVGERVRDMRFENNKLYLFLENTASLGIIEMN